MAGTHECLLLYLPMAREERVARREKLRGLEEDGRSTVH